MFDAVSSLTAISVLFKLYRKIPLSFVFLGFGSKKTSVPQMVSRGQLVAALAAVVVATGAGVGATFLIPNRGRPRPPKCPTKYVTMYETEVIEVSVLGVGLEDGLEVIVEIRRVIPGGDGGGG